MPTEAEFDAQHRSEFWTEAAKKICQQNRIFYKNLSRAGGSEHIVFLIDERLILKIFSPFRRGFEREKTALEFAAGKTSLKIPEMAAAGEFKNFKYLVTTQLAGELMTREMWLALPEKQQIAVVAELAVGLRELHSHSADSLEFDWHEFVERQSRVAVERQIAARVNPEWIERLPGFIEANLKLLPSNCPTVFLHGDVHFGNLHLQNRGGAWQISGLFDFADSLCGFHEFDFLAPTVLMIQGQANLQREFFKAYGYAESEINENLRKRLMLMTVLYECSDLRRYALRLKPEAVDFSFEELEKAIWNFC